MTPRTPDLYAPPPAADVAPPRRNPVAIVLAVLAALLLVAVAVLAALLIGAHSAAADLGAAERAEDAQQSAELSTAQRELSNAEAELAEAEVESGELEDLADAAEAALGDAEAAAVPDDATLREFLDLLRENNPAFLTVDDANLIELGQATCDYLDTFGNSDQNMAHVIDVGVASGIPARLSIEATSAALVVLCPQHKLD